MDGNEIAELRARVIADREHRGLTQEEYGEAAGVPRRTIQYLEAGTTKPQRATRDKLRDFLERSAIDRGYDPGPTTREGWPPEVQVFLDVMGAFLVTMPLEERLGFIHEQTRRIINGR